MNIAQEEQITKLKEIALERLHEATAAMYDYARECDVGEERTKAFEVYERLRIATRF